MKYDFLGIKQQGIYGINNPILIIQFSITEDDFVLEVKADGKNIEYECLTLNGTTDFLLQAKLTKEMKRIEVYCKLKDKDKVLMASFKNTLFLRSRKKITTILKKVIAKIKLILYVLGKGIKFLWKEYHFLVPISLWKKYFNDFKARVNGANIKLYNPFYSNEYNKWLKENKKEVVYEELSYRPLISLLIPVYNINRKFLSECLDSILKQTYDNFEICLVDDCSTLKEVKETLEEYKNKDKRVKVKYRKTNGHISKTTNDALKMAKGEYIGLIDDDDLLDKDALYEVVKVLNEDKNIDMIYTDEDKLDPNGNYCDPHFKPDYSPDTLLSLNYICHFTVIRKKIVLDVGGFEVGLEGSQDHDLFLKVVEKTNRIYHISKILDIHMKSLFDDLDEEENK